MTPRKIAVQSAILADAKKATDVLILDISQLVTTVSYLVICSVNSDTQMYAVAEEIVAGLEREGVKLFRRDGRKSSIWSVLDYGEVMVHIFHWRSREFYRIEKLWEEAKKIYWRKRK